MIARTHAEPRSPLAGVVEHPLASLAGGGDEAAPLLAPGDAPFGFAGTGSVEPSGIGCESVRFSKNAQRVRLASGPFGSAYDPPALPPDHAWPSPFTR
jgi:hypothetical protein